MEPGSQETFDRLCYLKVLACEYLAATKESSSLWTALEEINGLIDYLDLCQELGLEGDASQQEDQAWLERRGREARRLSEEITSGLRERLQDPLGLDPALSRHAGEISLFLKFGSRINSIPVPERKGILFDLVAEFEKTRTGVGINPLTPLLKEAREEMKSGFGLPADTFSRIIRDLSFADRKALHNIGIFRIRQELRHLVFSGKPIPSHLMAQVYCTPRLDDYLLCRDLLMGLQRRWGRFIPVEYNHYVIKFYREPQYWELDHLFLEDIDQLRLGLAYYRYSMELGKSSMVTSMIYRQALDCFKEAEAFLPETLREWLWGN